MLRPKVYSAAWVSIEALSVGGWGWLWRLDRRCAWGRLPRSTRAGGSTDVDLHAAHDALFASFLPVEELPNDPATTGLLKAARDGIWQQAGSADHFRNSCGLLPTSAASLKHVASRQPCREVPEHLSPL